MKIHPLCWRMWMSVWFCQRRYRCPMNPFLSLLKCVIISSTCFWYLSKYVSWTMIYHTIKGKYQNFTYNGFHQTCTVLVDWRPIWNLKSYQSREPSSSFFCWVVRLECRAGQWSTKSPPSLLSDRTRLAQLELAPKLILLSLYCGLLPIFTLLSLLIFVSSIHILFINSIV